jgi:hypothetical protein
MTVPFLFAALLIPFLVTGQQRPVRPGVREAEKLQDPANVPPQLKPIVPRADPDKLKSEAKDLAKRAQSIPAQIEHFTQGQHPGDLEQELKEIEKLAKQLRREISR